MTCLENRFYKDLRTCRKVPPSSVLVVERAVNVETTRWQIEEMDKAGMGGYFMHARGGLMTEYMAPNGWTIRAGLDEARRRGMSAWGYDENGWPSGFGNV